ncbi:MAG: RDD family protein [Blastocatellia bacterium]
MKCESCGNDLIGASIICRVCNHNNALPMRFARRRESARHNQSARPHASAHMVELPTITPRKDADVNLLLFPSASDRRTAPTRRPLAGSDPKTATYPPWRAELKERIRQIKEKRATNKLAAPKPSLVQLSRTQVGEAKLNRNPIVESALNRIRRASHETERQGERETEGRRDGETERQRDFSQSRPVVPSPHLLVPPSLRPPVSPSPRLSVPPSLRPSVAPSPVTPQTSTSKPSLSGPLAGAPYKHVETRVIEIAQVLERPRPEIEPAPLYARMLAGAYDFGIIFAAFLPIFGAYTVSNNNTPFGDESRLLMAPLLAAVVFIYQIVMLTFAGRTFGMALLKLNLVNTNDESMPVTLLQKILRASVATIVFICFPLYLAAGFSAFRRTLPDLVSGTTVT